MGSASGAKTDDVYCVSPPEKAKCNPSSSSANHMYHNKAATASNFVLRVVIFAVQEYESDARFCLELDVGTMDHAKLVKTGWLATRMQRSKATEVQIIQNDLGISGDIVDSFWRQWKAFDDPVVPSRLRFPNDQINNKKKAVTEFCVHINEHRGILIKFPRRETPFKLSVTKYERPDDPSVVSSWDEKLAREYETIRRSLLEVARKVNAPGAHWRDQARIPQKTLLQTLVAKEAEIRALVGFDFFQLPPSQKQLPDMA
ncbi:hypothetical protein F4859DRAFT_526108 [Xylaria cf. heliscus]|nr:hypothetical protein F4859DRAFT_526108 [Xylaria cf. heliscus]